MEGPKKKVKALDMTEDNPFYVKYMKGKEKFHIVKHQNKKY